jgi:hypothetical protein
MPPIKDESARTMIVELLIKSNHLLNLSQDPANLLNAAFRLRAIITDANGKILIPSLKNDEATTNQMRSKLGSPLRQKPLVWHPPKPAEPEPNRMM